MKLNFILQRRKILKKRRGKKIFQLEFFKCGTSSLVSLTKQRFELIYLRFIKKLLRRNHIKRKMFFRRRKFWLFLHPNCMLTGKTTNSRMGAGVGTLVRIAILLYAYDSVVEFKYYSAAYLHTLLKAIKYKYWLKFKLQVDFEISTW